MLCCSNALSFKPLLTAKPTMYFRYLQYSLVNVVFDDPHVWLIWMALKKEVKVFYCVAVRRRVRLSSATFGAERKRVEKD